MKYKIKITKSKRMEIDTNKRPSGEMTPEKRRKMEELALLRKRAASDEDSEGGEEPESSSQPPLFRRRMEESEREKEKRPPPFSGLKDISSLSERIKSVPRKEKVKGKSGSSLNKIIEWGILGLLIWTPLAAGSVSDWAVLIIQLTVLVMASAYIWIKSKPNPPEYFLESLKWRKYFFFGLLLLLVFQIIPLPKFLVKILSPNTYALKSMYLPDFFQIKFLSISVIPIHSLKQVLQFMVYILFGFLIIKTITKRKQILNLFYIIVSMGVFQAFYGLYELYNPNPRILFYKKIHNLETVTGTYVNRNHLSGYLEMAIPIAIGLILSRIDLFPRGKLKFRERILRLSERGLSTNLLLAGSILIMAIGIILSQSRSGVFILVFAFLLFLELAVLFLRQTRYRQIWTKRFLQIMFMGITLLSLYVGIEATLERFALEEVQKTNRPLVWANTMDIARDFPLFGTGLGTFNEIYPAYEIRNHSGHYSHAHNDYLEYLSELGIFGMVFLLGGILFLLYTTFRVWRDRRNSEVKGLVMGGGVAVICMLIHSIADFNLHIPANILLFIAVLTLTYNTAFYKFLKSSNYRNKV